MKNIFLHKRNYIRFLFGTLLFISIMPACLKKDFDFDKMILSNWKPNFSLPLIHSKLSLSKILNEANPGDFLIEDANHFLTLVYRQNIISEHAEDIFSVDDQFINNNVSFSLPAGFTQDSIVIPHSEYIVFSSSNNEILDTLILKSGDLSFSFQTDINYNLKIDILFPTVKLNNIPLTHTIYYNYTSGGPVNVNLDLTGYSLAYYSDGVIHNQLPIDYVATIYNNPTSTDQSPYFFNLDYAFQNIRYREMYGFINYTQFVFPSDTIILDIFKNSWYGFFQLEEPKLKFNVNNSFGLPLNIEFDYFIASNPLTPSTVNLSGLPNPFPINQPLAMGQEVQTQLLLDHTNSNVSNVILISPHHLNYLITGHANPGGVYAQNFMQDTSKFTVDIEVELPLYGRAWDFNIIDTIDYRFDMIKEAEYAKFKIHILNGFPIDARLQIYFADDNYVYKDSLFTTTQELILSAPIGPAPAYRVTTPRYKYTEALVNVNKLKNITDARHIIIKAALSTTNNGQDIMKIYSDYEIDVRLAIEAQLNVNLNN